MAEDKYVAIDKVADYFQVSVSTVRSWVRTGAVPETAYLKIGKTYRFQLPEVENALRAHNTAKSAMLTQAADSNPDQDL
jgi:excisionase family DNA binding protein